jgi:hypothetical protein
VTSDAINFAADTLEQAVGGLTGRNANAIRVLVTVARATCGTCRHANTEDAGNDALVYCTHPAGFYRARLMQATSRCQSYEAAE